MGAIPQGLVLGLALFNIIIGDMDNGIEFNHNKAFDGIKAL